MRETPEDWAFLIEPNDMLAHRLEGKMIKSDKLSMRTVNPRQMDLLAMFQYMIGNGDFSITGRHNLKIMALSPPGPGGFIPVPYDFDYTGLVNTHYALPSESLDLVNVRERYFLGPCRSESMYQWAIDELTKNREKIEELIMEFEYLPEEERLDMVTYLDSFWESAEEESFFRREIQSTCR
jgi:hypothetical protein